MISKLIHVANKLDELKKYKDADYLTDIIQKLAQAGEFPPGDDFDDEEVAKMRAKMPWLLAMQADMMEEDEDLADPNIDDVDEDSVYEEMLGFISSLIDGNFNTIEEAKEAATNLLALHLKTIPKPIEPKVIKPPQGQVLEFSKR